MMTSGERRSFSRRLRLARIAKGYSQEMLAMRLGNDQSRISQWETGGRGASAATLVKLANVLDVTPLWLLGET